MYRMVNGDTVKMTDQEELEHLEQEALDNAPATQAEQDAEIDALVKDIDTGKSLLRSLATEVFQLAKVADPTLTPAQFKRRIRDRVAGY